MKRTISMMLAMIMATMIISGCSQASGDTDVPRTESSVESSTEQAGEETFAATDTGPDDTTDTDTIESETDKAPPSDSLEGKT